MSDRAAGPAGTRTVRGRKAQFAGEGGAVEKVTGIGGMFFRSPDPGRSVAWYAEHLGVVGPPASYGESCWWQDGGPTVLAAMPADSELFERPAQSWAINFRVDDLDAMVEQLRSAGVVVEVDSEVYPIGRFATTHDPDGNPIQLWELAADIERPAP